MSKDPGAPANASSGPRPFQPIDRPEELVEIINEFLSGQASAMLWTKDREDSFHTMISSVSPTQGLLYVFTPADFKKEQFLRSVADTGGECFFSVSVSKANVFFKTKYLNKEDQAGLLFQFPKQLFKAQRRKEMRFSLPLDPPTAVQFEDPLNPGSMIRKTLLDVSAGGIAFVVDENDSALFFAGLKLRATQFAVGAKTLQTGMAEVRHSMPLPIDAKLQGFKVGAQFIEIPEAEAEWIRAYAFEQNKKAFTTQVG